MSRRSCVCGGGGYAAPGAAAAQAQDQRSQTGPQPKPAKHRLHHSQPQAVPVHLEAWSAVLLHPLRALQSVQHDQFLVSATCFEIALFPRATAFLSLVLSSLERGVTISLTWRSPLADMTV